MHEEVNSKFDGHDYPVKGTGPNQADYANRTVAHTRVDAHTFEVVVKLNGKLANTRRFVVSQDGKTLTDTGTGRTPTPKGRQRADLGSAIEPRRPRIAAESAGVAP